MILTKKIFDRYEAGLIFATGLLPNSPEGLFMTNNNPDLLKWVAVKGDRYDWAIYCHFSIHSVEYIKAHGDKVTNKVHIKKCIQCDDEMLKLYR